MTDPQTASADELPPGTRLGEFELRSVIGTGGFAIVYLAFDHALQREVAVKEYMPGALAGRSGGTAVSLRSQAAAETFDIGRHSFINEARLLAQFDHPSLLKVYRFWEANGTAYMAMPVLRGQSLKDVRRGMAGGPDEAWLRGLLDPLLSAIALLHDNGVYHRDISPDNIVLEPGGRPVLLDFGAARRVIGDKAQSLTAILKPAYAPIEQYAEAGAVKQGPWTDLYALGATLHYLLLGLAPQPSTARAVHDSQPPLQGQTLPGCSAAFLAVVDRMLQPRPADRPQSVAEVHALLAGASWPLPPRAAPSLSPLQLDPMAAPAPAPWAHATPPARSAAPIGPAPQGGSGWLARLWGFFGGGASRAPAASPTPQPWPAPAPAPSVPRVVDERSAIGPFSDDPIAQLFDAERTVIARAPGMPRPGPATPPPAAAGDTTVIVQAPRASPAAGPRAVALTVLRSDVPSFVGQVHVLAPGSTVVGRGADADLRLQDPLLTRQHARLDLTDRGLHMLDLGSSNGSFINGVLMAPGQAYPLHLGAQIQLGSTVLSVSLPGLRAIPDLTGQTIGGTYTLRACLQSSPKGVVYRAEKTKTGVTVAMKVLSPDYAGYPGYSERFAAEARIAARLQHPHICSLDDYGEAEIEVAGERCQVPYSTHMIMSGGSLADRVAEFGELPVETVARWVEHAADALQHAHGKGFVHGNLKPSTLCFDGDGNLYVTDFSVAAAEPGTHALFGTPAFMAPEQWAGEVAVPATDQYALAAVVYFVLTGSKPYDGQEDPDKRARNLAEAPPAAHLAAQKRYRRKLSPAVTAVLNKGLALAPADRYPTVAEFAQGLSGALKSGRSHQARQIFISYRRDDSAILATFIADQLEKNHGVTSFVDTQGMDGATRFPARIERAIQDCEVFVCILGAGTLQSGYVRKEITTAFELGKPMIPVFQEDYAAPPDDALDEAVSDLLQYDGIPLLDKRNVYVFAAVAELGQQIRRTLDRAGWH